MLESDRHSTYWVAAPAEACCFRACPVFVPVTLALLQ